MAVYLGSNKVAFKGGTFNTSGTAINNQNKIVAPTTSQQTVTYDSGYTGLGTVTVNRIPTNYIIPSGNKEITVNGTGIDVTAYATVSVAVPDGGGTTLVSDTLDAAGGTIRTITAKEIVSLQTKTITPTSSIQTVNPDAGYDGFSRVTVEASGETSMNVQVAQSTSRATSSSYTSLVSLTCTKTGTYNVYWTSFRSSTSGTWGSQLYLDDSAYGSDQSTFSDHIQNVELTGVQISANQTVAVYARSRGSDYYAYVSNLIIEQTA